TRLPQAATLQKQMPGILRLRLWRLDLWRSEFSQGHYFAFARRFVAFALAGVTAAGVCTRTLAPSTHVAPMSVARGNSCTPVSLLWIWLTTMSTAASPVT